jgi:hypothetical protein
MQGVHIEKAGTKTSLGVGRDGVKEINFDQGLVTVKFEKKKIHFGLANVVQMDELDEEAALTEAPKAKKAK